MQELFICEKCGKEFKTRNALSAHQIKHTESTIQCPTCKKFFLRKGTYDKHKCTTPKIKVSHKEACNLSDFNAYSESFCQFCNRKCHNLNSLKQHEIRCKLNPDKINTVRVGFNNTGRKSWNEGLTKETDERILRSSEKVIAYYKTHDGSFSGKRHSDEYKAYMSELAKERELGGFNMRKKGIIYNDTKLDSSYEVTLAKSLDENNIKWTRCNRFPYITPQEELHYYTPDFYLPDYDIYI